jgi:isopentenyldiphosphate isomerase
MDDLQTHESLQCIRSAVEQADHLISATTYHEVRDLFAAYESDPRDLRNLEQLAPEYGKPEFFLCVDGAGSPVHPTEEIIEDLRKTVSRRASFGLWFQEATVEEDGRPALLVARWLCHLVGFRHRSVHLFVDHPVLDDCTLVQVRGVQKPEFPGCFDVPAAGHVIALESVENTLFKELGEELDLSQDDIDDPEMIGSYDYRDPLGNLGWRNVEFRVVFRSRLKAGGLSKIKLADREVAAISVFPLSELQAMMDAFPERIASGLTASFPIYLRSRGG